MTAIFGVRGGPAATWVFGLGALTISAALLSPVLLAVLVGALLAFGVLVLTWRHPTVAWVIWVLVAGLSAEMAMSDVIGPDTFQPTIVLVKGTEIGLVALMMFRYGVTFDWFNPIWAFLWIAAASVATGLHPDLTRSDTLRSLVGSVTPFLVFFCAKPAGWGIAMRRAIPFAPSLSVLLGSLLGIAGLRSVMMESGGLRLAGLGHPAFLAGVCLAGIYIGLMRWLRTGSHRTALLLGVNLIILFLTGARAPAFYAAFVGLISLMLAPESVVPRMHRLAMVGIMMIALPVLVVAGETFSNLRLFEILETDPGHLSGRDLLWPAFEAAAAKAPWFGWGLGSGNLVLAHDSELAILLGTWAPHNEYLRLEVEGGQIGRALLIVLFVLWTVSHTRHLPRTERLVMRLIFVAYAGHAATDNVLISSPACVFFTFVAAMYAEPDEPASNRLRDATPMA